MQKTKQEVQTRLTVDRYALEQKLQIALIELKMKKPELFYLTETEQIAKLTARFMQWLFS